MINNFDIKYDSDKDVLSLVKLPHNNVNMVFDYIKTFIIMLYALKYLNLISYLVLT